jgi:protein-disulfide isomerase
VAISKRAVDRMSTGAVVLLAVCAVTMTMLTVRQEFFPPATTLTEPVDSVPNWAEFAVGGSRVGPSSPPVTLIVFSDYQCPVCRRLLQEVDLIRRMYPKDVAVVWRHLPLEGHANAIPAARASICAAQVGRFEAMHDWLFVKQDSLGLVPWSSFALRAGINDTVAFGACMRRGDTQARIDSDLRAAQALHAIGTPTVLVNELEYDGDPPDLTRIVRHVRRRGA